MEGWNLIYENKRYRYYEKDGYLARASKNTFVELGYIEDNWRLYERLIDSI